jgi:ATP-binding cassette subfamily B protein
VSYFADIELFENPQLLNLVQLTEKSKTSLKELAFIIMTSLRGIFVLIPTVILAGTIALWIPLLLLISAFPSVYVDLKYRKKTWDIEESQVTQARQMKIYREVLMDEKYAKELRLLNLQELFLGRWNSLFKSVFSGLQKTRSQGTFLIIFWSFFSGLGIILPYIYIILGTLNNSYTLGDLALYAGLILQIRRSLFSLINDTSDLYAVVLDIRPLFQVLDIQPKLTTKPAVTPSEQGTRGIKIENLSFTYPNSDRTILEDINLEIKPQEIIALVGENGEGKTTLIKLLCRLYDADAGNIFWHGRNLKEIPFNELRSQITTVMQDYVGFPVSIRENIGFGDLSILADEATIKKVLTQVGLSEIITELPEGLDTLLGKELEVGIELSQGQLQRLAIARALLRLPKTQLLILDEPTASLDPNTEYEIYDIFRSILADKMGLIITHRLALCHLADRIILLESGKILEEGNHEQLMQLRGKYYQMFTRQASSYLEQSPSNC